MINCQSAKHIIDQDGTLNSSCHDFNPVDEDSFAVIDHLQVKLTELESANNDLRKSAVSNKQAVEKLRNVKLSLEGKAKATSGKEDDSYTELSRLLDIKDRRIEELID